MGTRAGAPSSVVGSGLSSPVLTAPPPPGRCWQVLGISQEPGRLSSQLHEIYHQPVVPPFPVHRCLRPFGNATLWRPVSAEQIPRILLASGQVSPDPGPKHPETQAHLHPSDHPPHGLDVQCTHPRVPVRGPGYQSGGPSGEQRCWRCCPGDRMLSQALRAPRVGPM